MNTGSLKAFFPSSCVVKRENTEVQRGADGEITGESSRTWRTPGEEGWGRRGFCPHWETSRPKTGWLLIAQLLLKILHMKPVPRSVSWSLSVNLVESCENSHARQPSAHAHKHKYKHFADKITRSSDDQEFRPCNPPALQYVASALATYWFN